MLLPAPPPPPSRVRDRVGRRRRGPGYLTDKELIVEAPPLPARCPAPEATPPSPPVIVVVTLSNKYVWMAAPTVPDSASVVRVASPPRPPSPVPETMPPPF